MALLVGLIVTLTVDSIGHESQGRIFLAHIYSLLSCQFFLRFYVLVARTSYDFVIAQNRQDFLCSYFCTLALEIQYGTVPPQLCAHLLVLHSSLRHLFTSRPPLWPGLVEFEAGSQHCELSCKIIGFESYFPQSLNAALGNAEPYISSHCARV